MSDADKRRCQRYADEVRRYVREGWELPSGLLLGIAALLERVVPDSGDKHGA
jgi:hypothetical protein